MADSKGEFTAPPPGAPHEVTQPIQSETLAAQLAMARQNERVLQPFNPQPGPVDLPLNPPVHQEPVPVPPVSTSEPNAAEKLLEAARAQSAQRAEHPAASESDSPSRGIPKPITDPGKKITGGFGHVGEAQYYAITGLELAAVVRGEMDKLSTRMENDLRFSMALTYPRLKIRLRLEVESFAQNEGVTLEYIVVPEKQTPLDVARQHADEVCFVLIERRQEFDAAGEPEDAPDRMREDLGLPVPRKQIVDSGAGKQIVDIVPDIQESF